LSRERGGKDHGVSAGPLKRHILVDTLGLLLHAVVHPADIQDHDRGVLVLSTLFGMFPFLKKLFESFKWLSPRRFRASRSKSSSARVTQKAFAALGAVERTFEGAHAVDLPALARTALRPLVAQLMELRLQIKTIEKELTIQSRRCGLRKASHPPLRN
jgi:hypothetical protein